VSLTLLDTSVVSAVLRRRRKGEREATLSVRVAALLDGDVDVALPGIVFQELLSGIPDPAQRGRVLAAVRESFPVLLATEGDHLKAADLVSEAARRGVTVTTPDALIAAQALNRRASLFTADDDFRRLVAIAGLQLL
jgi:predicted nucleic acid-binding protein